MEGYTATKRRPCVFLFAISLGLCTAVSTGFAGAVDSMDTLVKPHPLQLAENAFIFNPRTHSWTAVHNGSVVRSGRASGGRSYCPDIHRSCRTPSGVFYVRSMQGPSCRSSRYPVGKGGAPMPYCMFFSQYYAVHGSYEVPNRNASHGCIRVVPSDAKWLHNNFMSIGTKVVVKPY